MHGADEDEVSTAWHPILLTDNSQLACDRNTTQSVHIDPQRSMQQRQDFSDFKRRCYGGNNDEDGAAASPTAPMAPPATAAAVAGTTTVVTSEPFPKI